MSHERILDGRFARSHRVEEMCEVDFGRISPPLFPAPHTWSHLRVPRGRRFLCLHVGVVVISPRQVFLPGLNDPAIVLGQTFRRKDERSAAESDSTFGPEDLESGLAARLVVERRAQVHGESFRVGHDRIHRVGDVARVLPAVELARRHHPFRHLGIHDEVDGRHQVHEQIRGNAAGVIPVTAPAEKALQAVRVVGSRPEELFPVHCIRRRVRRNGIDPGAARGVAIVGGADHRDLPERPALDELFRFELGGGANALASDLVDAVALLRSGDDLEAFVDRVGHRLFDVDVFACRERVERHLSVPVVRRADKNRIDIISVEYLAIVGMNARFASCDRFRMLRTSFIRVANRNQLDAREPPASVHQPLSPSSRADDADAHRVARSVLAECPDQVSLAFSDVQRRST